MTQVYNIPVTRAFSNLGKIGVGFQLFFFETGTTTKKTVFSDKTLMTPLANPVIANSNGYFPQIFMQSTGDAYKAILSDENDTDPPTSPIWTADPVEVDANNVNAFATRPAQHWGTTTNTATEYQISPKTPITSYRDDLLFSVEIHINNTGSATLAAEDGNDLGNFLTALNIKKYDGTGGKVNIEAGDLRGNQTYIMRIDSVEVVVLNPERNNITAVISTPPGMIAPFAFDVPPTGWLEVDGAAVSRTTFAALFTAIGVRFGIGDGSTTFNIPDLRGEFIRGFDNGRGVDPDAGSRTDSGDGTTGDNVGTKQDDAGRNITGTFTVTRGAGFSGAFTNTGNTGGNFACAAGTQVANVNFNASNVWTAAHTGGDFRGTNVGMMYCIKF